MSQKLQPLLADLAGCLQTQMMIRLEDAGAETAKLWNSGTLEVPLRLLAIAGQSANIGIETDLLEEMNERGWITKDLTEKDGH